MVAGLADALLIKPKVLTSAYNRVKFLFKNEQGLNSPQAQTILTALIKKTFFRSFFKWISVLPAKQGCVSSLIFFVMPKSYSRTGSENEALETFFFFPL